MSDFMVSSPVSSHDSGRQSSECFKVAVVGAGLAGLLTARLLHDNFPNKVQVSIHEAHPNRLGGRIHTTQDGPNGVILEAGAEFVNEDHPLMRKLCSNLEINLLPSYADGQTAPCFGYFSGRKLRTDFRDLVATLKEAVDRDLQVSKEVPDKRESFAKMTAATYIDGLGLQTEDTELLKLFVHTEQAVKVGKMSALFLLEWMDFDSFEDDHNSLFAKGDDKYRIAGGSRVLLDALAEPLHNSIETDKWISGVFESASRGRVRLTNDARAPNYFDAVVLAVPATGVSSMEVSSGLLKEMQAMNRKIRYASVRKTLAHVYSHLPWALQHCNQVLDRNAHALIWRTGQNPPSNPYISHVALYQGGDDVGYRRGRHNTQETITDSITKLYQYSGQQTRCERKNLGFGDLISYDYPAGAWIQPTIGQGGNREAFRGPLKRCYGRVVLCGEHLATENPETMEGAAESAVRACQNIAQILSLEAPEPLKLPKR